MALASNSAVGERLAFGEFELAPTARALWRAGAVVKLGSRALDILIALATRPGEVLSSDELTRIVWRGAAIDESALRVHMSAARKALGEGDRYIATVPGRGYSFVVAVERRFISPKTPETPLKPERLPPELANIVGRREVIETLSDEVRRHRIVTLAGPGGIGKTTVALAAARRLVGEFDAVAFVDLAPIGDGRQLSAAVAAALGLNLRPGQDVVETIAAAAEGLGVLLLVDNCEHLIGSAALFVEALVGRAAGVTVLATTREVLRAAGEWVRHLPPLETPPDRSLLSAEEARRFGAIEMFEDRAAHALGGYQLTDADTPFVIDICRRLDGVALAIELAVGQLPSLGARGLDASLDGPFPVLAHGRRTAMPRHQTLRATFDWSYDLLSPQDQALLRNLSVCCGPFTLDDAIVLSGSGASASATADRLASLLDKSLIAPMRDGATVGRYRLLETTRAYAVEKLEDVGEATAQRRRHAHHVITLFAGAQTEWDQQPTIDWLGAYAGRLGNLRAALDWCFSPDGDGAAGAALTAAAAPLWLHLSLLDEGLTRVERAIAWLKAQGDPDHRLLMQLYAVAGWPRMRAIQGIPSGAEAWKQALELAVELGDVDYQSRALWALWVDSVNSGAATQSLVLADRFAAVAEKSDDPQDGLIALRLRGRSLHFLGRFGESRRETERMLERYEPPPSRSHLIRFQYDQRLTAKITLARDLWLEGHGETALTLIAEMIAEAEALDHTLTLAHVLSDGACFIALWSGDLALAARYTAMLRAQTTLHALDVWRTYAEAFDAEILIRRGAAREGIGPLRRAIGALETGGFVLYRAAFAGVLAEGLIACGRGEEAEEAAAAAIDRCAGSGEAWCLPELMRIRGLALSATGRLREAQSIRAEALGLARAQGAGFWERRLMAQGSAADAEAQ